MESCPESTPWIIPKNVLQFLTNLESDDRLSYWKIQKDGNGFSLTVKFPTNTRKQGNVDNTTVPGKRNVVTTPLDKLFQTEVQVPVLKET